MLTDNEHIQFNGSWTCSQSNIHLKVFHTGSDDYNFFIIHNLEEQDDLNVCIRITDHNHAAFIGSPFFDGYSDILIQNSNSFIVKRQNETLLFSKTVH